MSESQSFVLEVKFGYLGLLKLLVIVSLQFDQRAKDVLVLVGIFIAQQHMLGLLVHSRFLQVFQGGAGVVLEGSNVKATVNRKCILHPITNSYSTHKFAKIVANAF